MSQSALLRLQNRIYKGAEQTTADVAGSPQGSGITTAQKSNPNVALVNPRGNLPGPVVGSAFHGSPLAQPVPIWFGLIALLVATRYFASKAGEASEYASIRIGFYNIVVITLSAVVGINLGKWVFGYWKLPGISALWLAT